MRLNVSKTVQINDFRRQLIERQDPAIQKATGTKDPIEVMAKLREMKNAS